MRKKIIGVILLGLLLVGSVACTGGGETGGEQLVDVIRDDLRVVVSGSGTIGVDREKMLSFGTGGKISEIFVEEGDIVKEGMVLAELDTSALELALHQAEVARDELQYNLDQLRDVLHASHDRIKLAEAQLEVAEQAVAEARKQLDETTITAPYGGVIASVYSKEGDIAPPPTVAAQPVMHLIDLDSMEVNAEVDEVDIADIEVGQGAIIEIDALPDVELSGRVQAIATVSLSAAGVVVYNVEVSLDESDPRLKVGMSATADIIISERNDVLIIPERAVSTGSGGREIVMVKVGEGNEKRTVVTGISDGIDVEIVEGLAEGDVVVIERAGGSSGGMF